MKYTKEDLMNTWGAVESKEHVDCIVDLCESLGVDVLGARCYLDDDNKYFSIDDDDGLCFWLFRDEAANFGEKKIKIPLPPKEKEWPQVGDEVVLRYKFDSKQVMHTGKLLYLSRGHLII